MCTKASIGQLLAIGIDIVVVSILSKQVNEGEMSKF